MTEMLQLIGLSATEDMEMVTQIKSEVRKLCNRNIIASQIVLNEADEVKKQNLASMIYTSQEELTVSILKAQFSLTLSTSYILLSFSCLGFLFFSFIFFL
jgi:hypothetical protein